MAHKAHCRMHLIRHIIVYLAVMTGLTLLAAFVTAGWKWVVWFGIGWGIGVAFHAMRCFLSGDAKDMAKASCEFPAKLTSLLRSAKGLGKPVPRPLADLPALMGDVVPPKQRSV